MFEYFQKNYTWNLAVMMVISQGGAITDVDDACRDLVELQTSEGGGAAWAKSWLTVAHRSEALARADERAKRSRSAAVKLKRAALYTIMAERMLPVHDSRHTELYETGLGLFRDAVRLARETTEFVTLDTRHGKVAALWCPANKGRREPAVIILNGLDGFKEFFYFNDARNEFLSRGISLLLVDQPGAGETLRRYGNHHHYDVEVTTSAAVDWLGDRPEVDPESIGLIGPSLGGYYGVRSAAREPRLACTALLGAIWDFGALIRRRLEGVDGEEVSVPEWFDSMNWFFGTETKDKLMEVTARYKVDEIIGDVFCPLLIVHGENDRQIPVGEAHKVYAAATSVADLELRIFTEAESSCEHCGIDNQLIQIQYIADWMGERLCQRKRVAPVGAPSPMRSPGAR